MSCNTTVVRPYQWDKPIKQGKIDRYSIGQRSGFRLPFAYLWYSLMCGIAGIIARSVHQAPANRAHLMHLLQQMTDALAHRGPDGDGHWMNSDGTVLLGHRRLAIIDLTDAAVQPMHYLNRYSIVHNGEIYNYKELRNTLEQKGYHFQSASDTEVILAAYHLWGTYCLQHFDGMFAFAIWDRETATLFAARDRFGIDPVCRGARALAVLRAPVHAFRGPLPGLYLPGIVDHLHGHAFGIQQPDHCRHSKNVNSPSSSFIVMPTIGSGSAAPALTQCSSSVCE
jgi:hypothetical protein